MEQTIMDEVRVPRIFVAISNAGKLETLKFSFSKKATKIWVRGHLYIT